MKNYIFFYIGLFIGLILLSNGCDSANFFGDASKSVIPDTTNLYKLANFIHGEARDEIIAEHTLLPNGKERYLGIVSVPQDNDDFRNKMLDTVYWRGISVINGDFRGASFRSSNCSEGVFTGSDFRLADMRWTNFIRSKLDSCNFIQARMFHVHVNEADLKHSKFNGTNMFGMEGHRANLEGCDMTNALLKDSEFLDANFRSTKGIKAKLIRAVMTGTDFNNSDFSFADFTGAGLEGAKMTNSNFYQTNFQGSHLQGTDFSGSDLNGCKFFAAELAETNFTGAKNIPEEVKVFIIDGLATGVVAGKH